MLLLSRRRSCFARRAAAASGDRTGRVSFEFFAPHAAATRRAYVATSGDKFDFNGQDK